MRKRNVLALVLAVTVALSATACGGSGSTPATTAATEAATSAADTAAPADTTGAAAGSGKGLSPEDRAKEFVTVGTGPTSGIYFPIGGAFATALKEYGYDTSEEATNATEQNIHNI